VLCCVLFLSSASRAAAPTAGDTPASIHEKVFIRPPSEWVDVDVRPPDEQRGIDDGGLLAILVDSQVQVDAEEEYERGLMKVTTEAGLQASKTLQFDFDPSYQTLSLHRAGIHRGDRYLDKLEPRHIQVIQQETDLERSVYNGRLSVILFLEDLRIGDVVEWASSTRGRNPVLGGKYIDSHLAQYPWTVERLRVRIVHDPRRILHVREYGDVIERKTREAAGTREMIWDATHVPAIDADDLLPGWYRPFPTVEISEFAEWSDVVEWGVPIYAVPGEPDSLLAREVARIERTAATPEDRLLAAVRFVQEEIRYLGITIGPGSLRPSSPADVLKRRFGDCKDKSLLLCALLRGLGIDGRPALVNTDACEHVEEWQPSPAAFDHVIVRARVGAESVWLDPTRTHERGSLENRSPPLYGRALVLEPGAKAFERIRPRDARSGVAVHETFVVEDYDAAPVTLRVHTTFTGREADWFRRAFAVSTREDYEQEYLNYYARTYPRVAVAAPLQVDDDTLSDRIDVQERYTIEEFWKADEDFVTCELKAHAIAEFFLVPSRRIRTMPLAVPYPFRRKHTIDVEMPTPWDIGQGESTIECPAFVLSMTDSVDGNTVRSTFELVAREDAVAASDVATYLAKLEEVDEETAYTLYRNTSAAEVSEGPHWPVLLAAFLWGLVLVAGARAFFRYSRERWPPEAPADADPTLTGIRGWLVLVTIGVVVRPVYVVGRMSQDLASYSTATWVALTKEGSPAYHPLWAPALVIELFGNIALLVVSILIAFLFFQRRRSLPVVLSVFLGASAIYILGDAVLAFQIPAVAEQNDAAFRDVGRAIVQAAIWIPYLLVSKRVRYTFVN